MKTDLLFRFGCLIFGLLLIATVSGCGKKGDPRPPGPYSLSEMIKPA